MSANKFDMLAREVYNWCKKHELWNDVIIYFNGKAWADSARWGVANGNKINRINDDLYEYMNKNPKDYFEYANPETLSMSFEGNLYYIMNGYAEYSYKLFSELESIFNRYGYYSEFGHAWNLALYEI